MKAEELVSGFAVGALLGALLVGGGGYVFVKQAHKRATSGWNLVEVVVAVRELPANTTLTTEDLAIRPVPEQFVTKSIVPAGSAQSLIGKVISVPMQPGDPMLESHFEARKPQPTSGAQPF